VHKYSRNYHCDFFRVESAIQLQRGIGEMAAVVMTIARRKSENFTMCNGTEVTLINPRQQKFPGSCERSAYGHRSLQLVTWVVWRPTSAPFTRTNGFRWLHASG